jgi:putative hydroxymethylpyrimidine transport system permease protein
LRRIEPGWLDLAHAMGASRSASLRHIRLPAAMPALATGLRLAAAVAPIAAIIGEWVGASAGLGYLMMQSLARAHTELAFAALLVLIALAVALYALVDVLMRALLPWHSHNLDDDLASPERNPS